MPAEKLRRRYKGNSDEIMHRNKRSRKVIQSPAMEEPL